MTRFRGQLHATLWITQRIYTNALAGLIALLSDSPKPRRRAQP